LVFTQQMISKHQQILRIIGLRKTDWNKYLATVGVRQMVAKDDIGRTTFRKKEGVVVIDNGGGCSLQGKAKVATLAKADFTRRRLGRPRRLLRRHLPHRMSRESSCHAKVA